MAISAFCEWPFVRLKFNPVGDVSFCCFQERGCLGNIFQNTLEEIWHSPLAEEVRQETMNGRLHSTCQIHSCPYFHVKERTPKTVVQFPVEFEIDLPTRHCNIGGEFPSEQHPACLMCERNLRNPQEFQQQDRLEELCKVLRPYLGNVRWLHIQGVAEPFWKDKIFELSRWLEFKKHRQHICLSTTTNGILLGEKCRNAFLQYPRSAISWSIDAGTPQTYTIIRRLDLYDRVVENLRAYGRQRRRGFHHFQIHHNINTINVYEVEEMVKLAAEVGVDQIDFDATYGAPGICVTKENVHLFREAQRLIQNTAKKLRVKATFMRRLTLDLDD